jgi:hypothetical protein
MMRACLVSGPAADLDDAGADRLRDGVCAVLVQSTRFFPVGSIDSSTLHLVASDKAECFSLFRCHDRAPNVGVQRVVGKVVPFSRQGWLPI